MILSYMGGQEGVGSSILPEMARNIRSRYLGAADPVLGRDNRRASVFKEIQDCKVVLATLDDSCRKARWTPANRANGRRPTQQDDYATGVDCGVSGDGQPLMPGLPAVPHGP
jgi:hypothetical protein